MNSKVCKQCKFFGRVSWDRNEPGCTQAGVTYGTDGYGPWYGGAACKHDPNQRVLKDLFEPTSEADREALLKQIRELEKQNYDKEYKIKKLEDSVSKLAKGENL